MVKPSESDHLSDHRHLALSLADLYRVLRSQQVKLTPQETDVIRTWQRKCFSAVGGGSFVTLAVSLAAPRKLRRPFQYFLAPLAGAHFGIENLLRSTEAFVDQILDLNRSTIQRELANIICDKHQKNPFMMDRIHSRFYVEKVFDVSSSDKPIVRWSCRNSNLPSDSHVSHS